MAQPIAKYDGNYITCFPSSNATDKGKWNEEFNCARYVTRVTSKNFCIVNPSYIMTETELEGTKKLQIGTGQCSINGMDLIMNAALQMDPPEGTGTFHVAFKLVRDSANDVLGDTKLGVTITFDGLFVSYYTQKPDPVDADMLYIGTVDWDGNSFSNITEDEDKYGRIWAEDILCKINDPKHPDITRLNLQEFIYNIPDWYVSKEGDVEYGAIEFLPGRDGTQDYGVKIQATDDNTSEIKVKAPSIEDSSTSKGYIKATNSSIQIGLGNTTLTNQFSSNLFTLHNEGLVNIESEMSLTLSGTNDVTLESGNNQHIIDGTTQTFKLSSSAKPITMTTLTSDNNVKLQVGDSSDNVQVSSDGTIILKNAASYSRITMSGGTSTYDVTITKPLNKKELNIVGDIELTGNLTATGDIHANKVYNAVYNDGIEYMEKEDYNEVIEPGDVVCFTDNGKVTKVKDVKDTLRVAGVVSSEDSFGFVLGGDGLEEDQKVPVALFGRVWVKVDCPVRTGNLLRIMPDGTVSVTNVLDRFVIGKATQDSEDGKVYAKIIN